MKTALLSCALVASVASAADLAAPVIPRIESSTVHFKLDGHLDDMFWEKALDLGELSLARGGVPQQKTSVKLFYTTDALFVGVLCRDARMDEVVQGMAGAGQATDVPIPKGADTFEVSLAPVGFDRDFFHLRIVPNGARNDARCRLVGEKAERDPSWHGGWAAATYQEKGGWSAEIKIPWNIFADGAYGRAVATPAKGDTMRMNLIRRCSTSREVSSYVVGTGAPYVRLAPFGFSGFDYGDIRISSPGVGIAKGANEMPFTVENLSPNAASVRVLATFAEEETDKQRRNAMFKACRWRVPTRTVKVLEKTYEIPPGGSVKEKVAFTASVLTENPSRLSFVVDRLRWKNRTALMTVAGGIDAAAERNRADREGPGALAKQLAGLRKKTPRDAFAVGTAPASEKVFRDLPFTGSFDPVARIAMAANEYESAQFVLFRLKPDPKPVKVVCGDLVSDAGARIDGRSVEVHHVGFVNVGDTGHHTHVGYWPDVLYPVREIPPPVKGSVQSVMLTVKTAADQPAGIYRGKVAFTSGGERHEGALEVEVFPFSLPDRMTLRMNIWFHGSCVAWFYRNAPFPIEFYDRFMELCGKYRFANGFRFNLFDALLLVREDESDPDGYRYDFSPLTPYYESSLRHGANVLNLDFMERTFYTQRYHRNFIRKDGSRDFFNPTDVEKAAKRLQRETVRYFKERGYWKYAILQVCDEPFSAPRQQYTRDTVTKYRNEVGEIPPVQTAGAERKCMGLDGYIDMWTPQITQFEPAHYTDMKPNEELWLYQCCFKRDFPVYSVDRPSIEPRIMSLICRKFNAKGFLYWSQTQWMTTAEYQQWQKEKWSPWICEEWRFPFSTDGIPGDGCFLYPTEQAVVPSLRAQYIRDGVEDYEYVEILSRYYAKARNSANISTEKRARIEQILSIPPEIVRATNDWTTDMARLEAFRREVAELISQLTGK